MNCVRIGGLEAFADDIRIPLKYGVDQCVGDTICAGGIMYGQRGIVAMLEFCRDIREVAEPDALLLNYANPMAMMTWAALEYGGVRTVGLCHGVQNGHRQIARALGVPMGEVDIVCSGINHQTWYLDIRVNGRKVGFEELLAAFERHPVFSRQEKVRIDVLKRFGFYSTESNGHLSEYLPWYRKRPEEIRRLDRPLASGSTARPAATCATAPRTATGSRRTSRSSSRRPASRSPSTSAPTSTRATSSRRWRPAGSTAATSTCATAGRSPTCPRTASSRARASSTASASTWSRAITLPLACAATCSASVNVQRMAVRAAMTGDVTLLKQAVLHDPLVGAICTPDEVWQMVDELLVAQAKWLPQYADSIPAAAARLRDAEGQDARLGRRGAAERAQRRGASRRPGQRSTRRRGTGSAPGQ